ncbi:MAG: hypothetical protein OXO50_16835 [Caldilineaceae bacterium]|nr:hypothetical protein [Caldilineaceae bacterium]
MNFDELAEELQRRYKAAEKAPENDKMLELHLFGIEHAHELTEDIDALAERGTGHANLGGEIRKGIKLARHVRITSNEPGEGILRMRSLILPFIKCEKCEISAQLWIIEGGFDHIVCGSCDRSLMDRSVKSVIEESILYLFEVRFHEIVRDSNLRRVNPIEEPLDEPTMPVIEGFKVDKEFASVIYESPEDFP